MRLLAGVSLRYLARRVGISPVYLSDIENNRKPAPSAEIIRVMTTALNADHDEFTRLAMKSVDDYGCVARKPRISEQLSTDEYLLIVRKKQKLEPDEFKSWLTMTAVVDTRSERKIKQRLRDIIAPRLLKDLQPALSFDTASLPVANGHRVVYINHYEGQSKKEAVEIYIDTCYREWRSIRSEFGRGRYLAELERCSYAVRTIAFGSLIIVEEETSSLPT